MQDVFTAHPTLGYLRFNPQRACEVLHISRQRLEDVLAHLHCQLHSWTVADVGRAAIGIPYQLGSKMVRYPSSLDCSGFTKYAFARVGIYLPRYTVEQINLGRSVSKLQPGDLVFTRGSNPWHHSEYPTGVGHAALVVDEVNCLHTTSKVGSVSLRELQSLDHRIIARRRIPDASGSVTVIELPAELAETQDANEILCHIRSILKKSRLQ